MEFYSNFEKPRARFPEPQKESCATVAKQAVPAEVEEDDPINTLRQKQITRVGSSRIG